MSWRSKLTFKKKKKQYKQLDKVFSSSKGNKNVSELLIKEADAKTLTKKKYNNSKRIDKKFSFYKLQGW